MAKKKSKTGRNIATGGIVGLILYFLLSGGDMGLIGPGEGVNNSSQTVEVTQEETVEAEVEKEYVVEINDDTIFLNDEEIVLDDLILLIGNKKQIVLRSANAKQVRYDEVKSLINDNDIVIIEE